MFASEIVVADKYVAIILRMSIKEELFLFFHDWKNLSNNIKVFSEIHKPAYYWQFFLKKQLNSLMRSISYFLRDYINIYPSIREGLNKNNSIVNRKQYLRRVVAKVLNSAVYCENEFKSAAENINEFLQELQAGNQHLANLKAYIEIFIRKLRLSIGEELALITLTEKNILFLGKQLVDWSQQLDVALIAIAIETLDILASGGFFGLFLIAASIIWIGIIYSYISNIKSELESNKTKKVSLLKQVSANNSLLAFLVYFQEKIEILLSQENKVTKLFSTFEIPTEGEKLYYSKYDIDTHKISVKDLKEFENKTKTKTKSLPINFHAANPCVQF